jgi:predicted HicB family RNase H-like nuclease
MNAAPEQKKLGRPPLPPESRKTARIELRTSEALAQKAQRLADTAGISRNAWIEQLIDRTREKAQ